ncbi:MAG: hypothetical protein NC483_02505 [Ruminococcus sp.]|nr:hypothetical protein [Ruminococcus sp.]
MKVEVKEYLKIGTSRLQNIEVYEYDKVKDLKDLKDIEPIYKGSVDEASNEIKEKVYVKCELGNPTIYYI